MKKKRIFAGDTFASVCQCILFSKYSYGRRTFSYKMLRYQIIFYGNLNSVEFELKYYRIENSYEKMKLQ